MPSLTHRGPPTPYLSQKEPLPGQVEGPFIFSQVKMRIQISREVKWRVDKSPVFQLPINMRPVALFAAAEAVAGAVEVVAGAVQVDAVAGAAAAEANC